MRVLVCGGRDFNDASRMFRELDRIQATEGRFTFIIEGEARGADQLAAKWAANRGVPLLAFPADWRRLGRQAGPIRNAKMLEEGHPDLVVAFPGGKGTADMIAKAKLAGVRVIIC